MSMDELEEIRRRKMMELQQQQAQEALQAEQKKESEQNRAAALREILSPDARERLARVRLARPEVATAVEDQIIGLARSGRLNQVVDDATLKQILATVLPEKREIKIQRR